MTRFSTRMRLALMALIIVIPALTVIVYDQSLERSRSRDRAVEDMRRVARLAAQRQAQMFDGVGRLLLTLSEFPGVRESDPSACNTLLPRVLRDHPNYINVWVANADGSFFCLAKPIGAAASAQRRAWFQRALATRALAVGDYQVSATNGQPDVVIARPLLDSSGNVERVLAVAIPLDQINSASLTAVPRGWTVTLSDRNHRVLARYPDGANWIGRDHSDAWASTLPTVGDVVEGAGADGVRRIYAIEPVSADLDTGLTITISTDPSAVFGEAYELLWKHMWLLGLVTLIAVAASLIGGRVFILRPVEALQAVTSRIADGDLGARAQLTAGIPGLSQLGGAINSMALALETNQRTLRESEQRFRQIAETITEVFWMCDVETSRMLYVSPAYERIWGRTCESLYHEPKSFLDAIHPDDRDGVMATLQLQQQGEPFDHEYRIVRPDGDARWIWDRGFPVVNPGKPVTQYVGAAQDVTVRRETNQQIQLLAQAIESTNEMVSVTNLDNQITFVNKAFLDTYGYQAEEVIGQTPEFLRSPDVSAELVDQIHEQTCRGGWRGEIMNRRNDGSELCVSLNTSLIHDRDGKTVGLLGVARDMTDHIRAERAVAAAEARMRFALEASHVGVWESDLKTGVSHWSETCEHMHGLPTGGFGKTFEAFIALVVPEDRQDVMKAVSQAMQDRHAAKIEYRTAWPDGSMHRIATTAHFSHDENGQPTRGAGFSTDVTEQRSLEDQLRQSQKMEAVGQLAGGIAHDFNNMLTAILGNAELVLQELAPDGLYRVEFEEIVKAGRRAASLTHQLLAFSRKQVLTPRVLRVGDTVSEVLPMLRRLIGESIDLKLLTNDRGHVKADAGQIEQVLVNLAVNARDAMRDGGRLTIEVTDITLGDDYARGHANVPSGPYVMIAVSDTGHGMDAAVQKRVFEPFFTTKPQGEGTGLGLATVYGIVKQSGGHIALYSEVEVGTTFKVYLPQTTERDASASAGAANPRRPRGTETILLVEDERAVRDFVSRVLLRHGYTVHAMGDPKQAINFAEEHSSAIHLILTDVVLPGMNGPAMAATLVQRHTESKVLFSSGYTDNAIIHHGVLDDGMWFIQKPFTADALLTRVREVIDAPAA